MVTIFLFGCGITGKAVYESGQKPEIYFCPKDNCGNFLAKNILNATDSVYCALYDLDLRNVIAALANKSGKIDVKLVMDNDNDDNLVMRENVRFDDSRQLMHNKFCVIDNRIVITGSFNPTNNDNYNNNNNMLVIYSNALSENYKEEFDELWSGNFGEGNQNANSVIYINGKKIENYFCPEDSCAGRVISSIESAESSVYFMAFTFTHEGIADALLAKGDMDVRGIFDSGQSSSRYSQLKRLKEFGMDVKKDSNKYKLHHKVFIIDNQTVITGSFNPTASADTKNDENILVIHDKEIASLYLKEFDSLWG
ncbi:hypothetical protein HYX06_02420 [Candidatus Woesearchaeota archaeon]|nr:hypothetical protein [Candidatus Woesearchaeota archaeon]